jgi:hypothetical protein
MLCAGARVPVPGGYLVAVAVEEVVAVGHSADVPVFAGLFNEPELVPQKELHGAVPRRAQR